MSNFFDLSDEEWVAGYNKWNASIRHEKKKLDLEILELDSIHPDWKIVEPKKEKKCDCGAEKCKTTHTYWCSKYEG